ncbi:galactose-1-phosphate uridylyltransferase [Methanothrix sp.]|uniref:galactose-1-phosphate uridylyltransferase n=1 Tax=Methanothrix sp. TaxID=90426 RepID=UPI003D13B83D
MAKERARRPTDFIRAKEMRASKECPFCPGNEEMTPKAVAVYRDDGVFVDGETRIRGWWARCIPNMYPAMVPDPDAPTPEWMAMPARGGHEVIIESPDHESSPAIFDDEKIIRMIRVYADRYRYHTDRGSSYVSIFKNWGREAGASLSHTHTQLIALPMIPPLLMREVSAISSMPSCPYCNIAEREASSERLIFREGVWICIAPFYSQTPYEMWILPCKHISSILEMSDSMRLELGRSMKKALQRLSVLLNDPPYNYMIFQMSSNYHLNIRIQPAISKIAGFEKNTGIYINPVSPEQAASELRSVL